jgi:hypothetical protein
MYNSFIFAAIVLVIGFAFCFGWQYQENVDSQRLITVAVISPYDSGKAQRILNSDDIPAAIDGSVEYKIRVPLSKQARAIQVLKRDFAAKGYWIKFEKF